MLDRCMAGSLSPTSTYACAAGRLAAGALPNGTSSWFKRWRARDMNSQQPAEWHSSSSGSGTCKLVAAAWQQQAPGKDLQPSSLARSLPSL